MDENLEQPKTPPIFQKSTNKKKTGFIISILLIFIVTIGVSGYYYLHNKNIIHKGCGEIGDIIYSYAKDNCFVYTSYRFDGEQFSPDEIIYTKIVSADPDTFVVLSPNFAKDRNSVFYEGKKINEANSLTFEVIDKSGYGGYAKDDKFVYWEDKILNEADVNTFIKYDIENNTGVTQEIYMDERALYKSGMRIEGVDKETFEFINYTYAKDKNNIYCINGEGSSKFFLLEKVDPLTFEVNPKLSSNEHKNINPRYSSSSSFARDKNNFYYDCYVLKIQSR